MPKKGKPVVSNSIKARIFECECPMCKTLHKQLIVHKGSTRPWIYCKLCQPKIASRASHIRPAVRHYPARYTGYSE